MSGISGRFARAVRACITAALLVGLMPMGSVATAAPSVSTGTKQASQPKPPIGSKSDAAGNPYVAEQVLVHFKPSTGVSAMASAHTSVGAKLIRNVKGAEGLQLTRLPKGASVESAIARYSELPGVLYAQPNYLHHIDATPNDPRFDELWGMNNTGQTGGTIDADIDATVAWEEQTGSSDVIVAVIDTGVDYNHPDLADNMWVNTGEIPGNMLDDDGNGFVDDIYGYDFANRDSDPIDDHSHGTHTSGTIGAVGNNGIGVSGVAQDVRIMAMKFLTADGWGTTDAAIECIEYADMMGADIMSNSWGGGPYEQALADAIANTDALFVAAAGNDSSNTDWMPNYPSCYDSPNVVAIGATDHNDEPAWFTNYGAETVDVFAPGDEILSTVVGPAPRFTPDISSQTPVSDCSSLAGWDVAQYNNAPWALSNAEFVSAPSSFALFDYGDDEDSWIKSTTPLDLSSMSGAMLRFQAYYDTEEGFDSLFGWASADGVTWSQLGTLSGSSGGFVPQTFDLSGFSGASSVYIAFSFTSDGSVSSGDGFTGVAIDDIELVETDPLFADRFDSLANWDITSFARRAWSLSTAYSVSAPSSAGNIDYRNSEDAWLTLNTPIDMSAVTGGVALGCNLFYEIEPGVDFLRSMASSDGVTWQPVASFTGFSSWMGGGFTHANIDLSAFAGEPSVHVAFQLVSDNMFSSDVGLVGVAVDDVSIVTGTWTEADYSNAYATMSGTSMATPHAAGIAALALSQWPDLDAPTLKKALLLGSDPIDALGGMCVSGGRANAYTSIQDIFGPTITHDAVAEYASRATITLQASDPSGVDWIAYAFDGDEPTYVYDDAAVALNSIPGNRTLNFWAQDGLGNVSDAEEISFHITRGVPTSKSVAGADRFATAVKASQMSFPDGADTVVIATGRNWPDALGGTALAGAVDGPLLLCDSTTLPAAVATELERLGTTTVYVLGGTRAVSSAVLGSIEDVVGNGSVTRVSGADRYATARMVADQVILLQGPEYDGMAFVATGENYPDALAAAPVARHNGWPLLLADPEGSLSIPSEVTSAVILGGESAVPAGIEAGLHGKLGEANVIRKGASDRYGTSALVAAWSTAHGMYWEGAGIVTGTNFADALAGGAMLGARRSLMLLTRGTTLSPAARAPLSLNKEMIQTIHFIGGTNAVSQATRDSVMAAIK